MKYTYIYKTSDGVRHEAAMDAASRDDVFIALRKQGIKPVKVIAADGSKANGEVRVIGVRKRMVALIVVAVAVLTGFAVLMLDARRGPVVDVGAAVPLERQAIRGDRARVERAREGLPTRAERFLSRFAEPGCDFAAPETDWPSKAEFEAVLSVPIRLTDDELTESVDLKRIVERMKREMADYLRAGGLVSGYIRELIARQNAEKGIREKAVTKLDELLKTAAYSGKKGDYAAAYEHWLKANAQLQSLGVFVIPIPDALKAYQQTMNFDE